MPASTSSVFCKFLLVGAVLGLFFGLFFGLNYPEIVRSGWPLTRCTVLSVDLDQRYCCESKCSNVGCITAFGAPNCGSIVSQINGNYNPEACAANSTACPPNISVCDGGYYCCSKCCQTCTSCSTSCTGSGSSQHCSESCTSTSCNCSCCQQTYSRSCTLSCPTCTTGIARVSYTPYGGSLEQATYTQNFGKNSGAARDFELRHPVNSTARCYYNPSNYEQVTFDVNFTAWKWAITAIFGMVPLLALIIFGITKLFVCCLGRCGLGQRIARVRNRNAPVVTVQPPEKDSDVDAAPPPPYEPSRSRPPSRASVQSRASSRHSHRSGVGSIRRADAEHDGTSDEDEGSKKELPRTATM